MQKMHPNKGAINGNGTSLVPIHIFTFVNGLLMSIEGQIVIVNILKMISEYHTS